MEKKVYDNFKNLKNCNLKKKWLSGISLFFPTFFMYFKHKVYISMTTVEAFHGESGEIQ